MKHVRFGFIALALMLCLTAFGSAALAESCYVGCTDCKRDADCALCTFCIAVTATARPRQEAPCPTETCSPVTPAPVATKKPLATQMPDYMATARPAATATLQPAATATIRPAVTATVQPRPTATAPSSSTGDYTTISVAKQEEIALSLLNQDRMKNGLPALTPDPALSRIARIKSQDMRDNHYFAHESPTYGRAAQMLTHFGYAYQGVGENIAHHATVEKSQAAFMSSQGHRANILGKNWTKVGIGVAFDQHGYVYVTQLFVR